MRTPWNAPFRLRHLAASALMLASGLALAQSYPETARQPVQDRYHGTVVSEDYRWLEDADSPDVKAWVAAQNALSRSQLDAIPGRAELGERIKQLLTDRSSSYSGLSRHGSLWFAVKHDPRLQQPQLVSLASPDRPETERVVLDPNNLSKDGSVAMDWFEPSPDGSHVAVSLSEKGSERGSLHVFEVKTGQRVDAIIPRVQFPTGGGTLSWHPDGKGFLYTRYPAPGERPEADQMFFQQLWEHRLGQPLEKDTLSLGADFPRIAEIFVYGNKAGEQVAKVLNGDGGEVAIHLRDRKGRWHAVSGFQDGVKDAVFGSDGHLYLLSVKDAPKGQVLRVKLSEPVLAKAEKVQAEGEGTITQMKLQGGKLYTVSLLGGPSQLSVLDLKTRKSEQVHLPDISAVDALVTGEGGELLASIQSYTQPQAWYRIGKDLQTTKTALATRSGVDFSDCEVLREFAVSKDGTRVPLNIIRRKGTVLDGRNPTLLYAYGGYSVSQTPGFSPLRKLWLERGGVMVIANLRGGGEYGEAWHLGGNLTRKQNVFDDFIASAETLVKQGYTEPAKLAIQGGSNGGLLMGAVLTQRPDLFRVVHSAVGIYDMLRVELDANGAFNITEFGTVKDPAQFQALYGYSPLHRVKDGTRYPAVLFTTGDHDGRVNPMQSRKMTARLQAAQAAPLAERPILLRTSANAGHGMGSSLSEVIAERTDSYAFLMQQLGMPVALKP